MRRCVADTRRLCDGLVGEFWRWFVGEFWLFSQNCKIKMQNCGSLLTWFANSANPDAKLRPFIDLFFKICKSRCEVAPHPLTYFSNSSNLDAALRTSIDSFCKFFKSGYGITPHSLTYFASSSNLDAALQLTPCSKQYYWHNLLKTLYLL